MSITAYKIESVGHDRSGKDYGYVNIMYRTATSGPVPSLINAKRWKSCGRMRASMGPLLPAARWVTLS